MKVEKIQRYPLPASSHPSLGESESNVEAWQKFFGELIIQLSTERWVTHVYLDMNDPMNRRFSHVVLQGEIEV